MKLYIYNCNNQNQFLEQVQTEDPNKFQGCSTEVPPKPCYMLGASYGFDPETNDWTTLVSDWRGVTLYRKDNSFITMQGKATPLESDYTPKEPPNLNERFIWNDEEHDWELYTQIINPVDKLKQYEDTIQKFIDRVAQDRGYDNGYTCASYYRDKDPQYASDAKVFKDWRSDVWVAVNQVLNQCQSSFSNMEVITEQDLLQFPSVYQILNNLPTIEWIDVTVSQ